VEGNSRPGQHLLGYWNDLLERTPDELDLWIRDEIAAIGRTGRPYLLVTGNELPDDVRELLAQQAPQVDVEIWTGTGHFPHLAHPERFARRLAATGQWRSIDDRHASPNTSAAEAVIDAHFRAERLGDVAAILATFTEDVMHQTLGAPHGTLVGRPAIEAFYRTLTADLRLDGYVTTRRIVGPHHVWEEGIARATAIGAPLGFPGHGRAITYRLPASGVTPSDAGLSRPVRRVRRVSKGDVGRCSTDRRQDGVRIPRRGPGPGPTPATVAGRPLRWRIAPRCAEDAAGEARPRPSPAGADRLANEEHRHGAHGIDARGPGRRRDRRGRRDRLGHRR
jgi:hypothetical protein